MNKALLLILVTALAVGTHAETSAGQHQKAEEDIPIHTSNDETPYEDLALSTKSQGDSGNTNIGPVDGNKVEPYVEQKVVDVSTEATTSDSSVSNNVTAASSTEISNSTVLVACRPRLDSENQIVELVNATGLLSLLESEANVTSRRSPAQCLAIMFYASWCPFSCLAAPHFNALPRAYPDIKVAAIDSMKHYSLNTQFGIVGVPTILLFHNGRPTARFNDSDFNLKTFSRFITKYTGLEPKGLLNVTSADFAGPVSSVVERETDHWLILSWVFVAMCALYFLVQSAMWRGLVETMKNIWREADEAQAEHEHAD